MQKCTVTVRLAGSLNNTVVKQNVTPAEILILRHIHGSDAVVDIRPTEFDERVRSEEDYDRLKVAYDPSNGGYASSPDEDAKSIMQALFPGALKKLPTLLSEIGIEGLDPEPEAPRKKGKAAKAEKAPEPVADEGPMAGVTVEDSAPTGLNWGAGDGEGDDADGGDADGDEKDA